MPDIANLRHAGRRSRRRHAYVSATGRRAPALV